MLKGSINPYYTGLSKDFCHAKSDYRFHFNGQETDDEIAGKGNINTAEYWEYDTRLGRRWNVDPKPDPSISVYACFRNNPVLFVDIDGDTVKYGGFIDKVNSFLARTFNKSFRENFKKWDASSDVYTIKRDKYISRRLVDAKPDEGMSPSDPTHHSVRYDGGFGIQDISNNGLRNTVSGVAAPLQISWSLTKLSISLPLGAISAMTGNWYHWGAGDKIYLGNDAKNGILLFGWGLGNYNEFNMFFQNQTHKKISPDDGLIGLRMGFPKRVPNFVDIFGRNQFGIHAHFNLVFPKDFRHKKLDNESVVDFHQ